MTEACTINPASLADLAAGLLSDQYEASLYSLAASYNLSCIIFFSMSEPRPESYALATDT